MLCGLRAAMLTTAWIASTEPAKATHKLSLRDARLPIEVARARTRLEGHAFDADFAELPAQRQIASTKRSLKLSVHRKISSALSGEGTPAATVTWLIG